jgi:hypothetical protein
MAGRTVSASRRVTVRAALLDPRARSYRAMPYTALPAAAGTSNNAP